MYKVTLFPLPPELEKLWQEMQDIQKDPNFWKACERLDKRFRESYERLIHIPRIWLADRRENQVREALFAIRAELDKLKT